MPGLIDKAVQSGSDNPEAYCRQIPRAQWVMGGYHLQASPKELAQTISAIRTYSAPRSMLCIGVESCGVERFFVEELGILSIRFLQVNEGHPAFERNSSALEDMGVRKANCDKFDLIVFMGGDFEAAKPFIREGTVVVVLETGIDSKRPVNRSLWHEHRKSQNTILHTHDRGIGVFLVKNLIAMGLSNGNEKRDIETANAVLVSPEPDVKDSEERDGIASEPDSEGESPEVAPKRRGRPKKGA